MITIKELNKQLSLLGYPIAYNHFLNTAGVPVPSTPFLIWLEQDSQNFGADNKVWTKVQNYEFELYVDNRDFELEEKIEKVLTDNSVYFETDCNWIESERMHQTTYYITLLKK